MKRFNKTLLAGLLVFIYSFVYAGEITQPGARVTIVPDATVLSQVDQFFFQSNYEYLEHAHHRCSFQIGDGHDDA